MNRCCALVSKNDDALAILKATGIQHYFDHVVGRNTDKTQGLQDTLVAYPEIPIERCYFYYDMIEEIEIAKKMGINGHLVDWKTGAVKAQVLRIEM